MTTDFSNLGIEGDLGEPEGLPPEESSNRMFWISAGVLGGIALLALICIGVYFFVLRPQQQTARSQQQATIDAQNTEVAAIIVSTSTAAAKAAIEAAYTPTASNTPIPPTATITPTSTPVVAVGSPSAATDTPLPPEMLTATALYPTLTANAVLFAQTLTARPTSATQAIPSTGFADEVGLPMMLGLAVLLIVIILLARRLRTA